MFICLPPDYVSQPPETARAVSQQLTQVIMLLIGLYKVLLGNRVVVDSRPVAVAGSKSSNRVLWVWFSGWVARAERCIIHLYRLRPTLGKGNIAKCTMVMVLIPVSSSSPSPSGGHYKRTISLQFRKTIVELTSSVPPKLTQHHCFHIKRPSSSNTSPRSQIPTLSARRIQQHQAQPTLPRCLPKL